MKVAPEFPTAYRVEKNTEVLLAGLRRRDAAAFEQLVHMYRPRLLRVAWRLLGNEDEAQDAVQDAFLSVFRAIDGFEGRARLSSWLHRIVSNAALMKLRTRRQRSEVSLDGSPELWRKAEQAESGQAWENPVSTFYQAQETRSFVQAGIAQLPEIYRTVLILRDIEGLDTYATASRLGVSSTAVKLRVHRARRALGRLLNAQEVTTH